MWMMAMTRSARRTVRKIMKPVNKDLKELWTKGSYPLVSSTRIILDYGVHGPN